jgi:hypothetical protein
MGGQYIYKSVYSLFGSVSARERRHILLALWLHVGQNPLIGGALVKLSHALTSLPSARAAGALIALIQQVMASLL